MAKGGDVMTKSEALIYSLKIPTGGNIRPLALVVDFAEELLFVRHVPVDHLQLSWHVYPYVARQLGKSVKTVARSIERRTRDCWDYGDRQRLEQLVGRPLLEPPTPRHMVLYLAYYAHFGISFYQAVEEELKSLV